MGGIHACDLPEDALLRRYDVPEGYADCYAGELSGTVSLAAYVEAFYTTGVFKLERLLLSRFAALPSTDAEARSLAAGERQTFAAWKVEARGSGQLLLAALGGRTRSWLMCAAGGDRTRLFFGSAVVPVVDKRTGERGLAPAYRALLGFHKLYSRLLLGAAMRKVRQTQMK